MLLEVLWHDLRARDTATWSWSFAGLALVSTQIVNQLEFYVTSLNIEWKVEYRYNNRNERVTKN